MVCRNGISLASLSPFVSRFVLPFSWVLPCLLAMVGPVAAQDCAAVAAATVLELKAGAGDEWRSEDEALARRAAGAACVKARSGRYAPVTSEALQPGDNQVLAADGADSAAGAGEASTTAAAGDSAGAAADQKDDDGFWPFGEFKINDVSASPSKKPYERRRFDKDN